MMKELDIIIKSMGIVRSSFKQLEDVPIHEHSEQVEIFPQYTRALHRIEENLHLWPLLWLIEPLGAKDF